MTNGLGVQFSSVSKVKLGSVQLRHSVRIFNFILLFSFFADRFVRLHVCYAGGGIQFYHYRHCVVSGG